MPGRPRTTFKRLNKLAQRAEAYAIDLIDMVPAQYKERTLISLKGGPGGTALVDIDTTTAELNAGSRVEVTTTFRGTGVLDGVAESFTTSVVLDPVEPF
jgi:hypothetical protein